MRLISEIEQNLVAGGDMFDSGMSDSGGGGGGGGYALSSSDAAALYGNSGYGDSISTEGSNSASLSDAVSLGNCAVDVSKAVQDSGVLNVASAVLSCAPVAASIWTTMGPDSLQSNKATPYKANQY